jgi:hypothetical protein
MGRSTAWRSDNKSRPKSGDELVSWYKDRGEPVSFHDVEMKGHIREESGKRAKFPSGDEVIRRISMAA